jgi:hypothetical protein
MSTHPKAGDLITHCGHLKRDLHWFYVKKGLAYIREGDTSKSISHWMGVCETCLSKAGSPELAIREDGVLGEDVKISYRDNPEEFSLADILELRAKMAEKPKAKKATKKPAKQVQYEKTEPKYTFDADAFIKGMPGVFDSSSKIR